VVCPQCQHPNPPGTTRCVKCHAQVEVEKATIFEPVEGATIIAPVESSTPPEVKEAASSSGTGAWSKPAGSETSAIAAGMQGPIGPGSVLADRYELQTELGEGGMGTVYKARDRELDRIVALKVIRPELARHAEILQRFKRELILARQVTHRNVIRIFDLGVTGNTKFITMEYLEGQDLKHLLRNQKFTTEQAVDIFCQVCRGLQAAHAENVIHRDLKPQNIMVDQQGKVLVMDFGLAHSVEERGMTQTGALMGTPDYMSPEQAKGEKADARSDLFSLGIIFYELLTGKLPFTADSLLGTLLARTQQRAEPVREINPEVPQVISDIVAKCLATDAAQRYQTASELLADLEAWQGGAKGQTIRVPKAPRLSMVAPSIAWKWIALSVAGVAILLSPLAWYLLRSSDKPAGPALSLAIVPFHNASGVASLDWMGPELAAMLRTDVGQSARLQTVSSDRVAQILHDLQIAPGSNVEPDTLRRIADATSADRLLSGQFAKFGDQIQIDVTLQDLKRQRTIPLKAVAPSEKDLPKAVEQLARDVQKSLALPADVIKELQAKALKPSTQSVQALRYYNEGLQLAHQGKNMEAVKSFQASVKEDANFALAYAKLGQAYASQGYGNEAEQAARKAVDLSEKLAPQEKYLIEAIRAQTANDNDKAIEAYQDVAKALPDDPDVQFALAGLYYTVGSFDKARDYYAKLLKRDPKYVEALSGIAWTEMNARNLQAALEYLNRALPITVELDNEQQRGRILYGLGMTYSLLNKPEEALRNYQQALDIQSRSGDKHDRAQTLNGMGQVQDTLGKSEEALKSYQQALALREELGDKAGTGDTLIDLSVFYQSRGENDRALTVLKRSLQIQRDIGNRTYEGLCLNNIGANYDDKGQYDDALTFYEQALGIREKSKDPATIAQSHYNVADTQMKLGQYDQALTHYLRALDLGRSVNDKRDAAFASQGLGDLFEQQGRLGAALKSKEDALKMIRETHDQADIAGILNSYASSLILLGRTEDARKAQEEGVALANKLNSQPLTARNLNVQGDSLFYRADYKGAGAQYEQALALASKTADRRLILTAKFNLARVAVRLGRSRETVSTLRKLAEEADALGLKYVSVECSVYLGEALVNAKNYPESSQEVNRALARSEKLGLQPLQAKSHYLLATALRLTGNGAEASRHYANAHRILDEINKEAKSDTLLKRADLAPIYAESAKWSQSPPG